MPGKAHTVVGLGELLWDMLPTGKQLGGAPANFAYIANLLGDKGIPASRVGCDALGEEALRRLHELGVTAEFVQKDSVHPTGTVNVEVDAGGQPRFDISQDVAWDFLEWTPSWQKLATDADSVCFGSLAQRSSQSRATIRSFLSATGPETVRIFDVNLRQNFYSAEILAESMRRATIVKMNHEELPRIMRLLEFDQSEGDDPACLLTEFGLKLVCITRGECGSLLLTANDRSEHPGLKVKVVDTVGAGDAFSAAMAHCYLREKSLAEINETANRVGAWVAGHAGATPPGEGFPSKVR